MTAFWACMVVCFLMAGFGLGISEHARRSARPRFQPVEYHPVGPVSGFNVGRLTREYFDREDMDGYDFERRLDEFVENSAVVSLDDVSLIQASAAVMAQSSAGVIPSGMSVHGYAEQLRDAGFAYEPVDFIHTGEASTSARLRLLEQWTEIRKKA